MLYHPDGDSFLTYQQLNHLRREAQQQAEQERQRAEQERLAREEAIPRFLGMGLNIEQIAEALSLSVAEVSQIVETS